MLFFLYYFYIVYSFFPFFSWLAQWICGCPSRMWVNFWNFFPNWTPLISPSCFQLNLFLFGNKWALKFTLLGRTVSYVRHCPWKQDMPLTRQNKLRFPSIKIKLLGKKDSHQSHLPLPIRPLSGNKTQVWVFRPFIVGATSSGGPRSPLLLICLPPSWKVKMTTQSS